LKPTLEHIQNKTPADFIGGVRSMPFGACDSITSPMNTILQTKAIGPSAFGC
jgi:hypothetical protein